MASVLEKRAGRAPLSTLPLPNHPAPHQVKALLSNAGLGVCGTEAQKEAALVHGYGQDHKGAEDLLPTARAGRSAVQHTPPAGLPAPRSSSPSQTLSIGAATQNVWGITAVYHVQQSPITGKMTEKFLWISF